MINSIRQAINWLVEGLMLAWTDVEERLRPRQRFLLVRAPGGYALQRPDGQVVAEHLPLDGATAEIPAQTAALVKDGDVDVVLPTDELLIRTLDPLPAQSRPYLGGIVRHQLERLIPWRASDVLHSYQTAPAGPEDSRLIVTIAATARSLHRGLLESLPALQPHSVRLVYRGADGGKDIVIDVSENSGSVMRAQWMRRTVGLSVAALAGVSLLGIVLLAFVWQRTGDKLEMVARDVADARAKLAAKGPAVPAGDRDIEAIFKRRLNTPLAVLALDALSESLPDDTSLTELRIGDGRARMTGISRSVSRLVPLLEASPTFADATFFAPTTRLPNSQGDRFHLDARLVPAGERKP